jgi:hypothetical protein
MRKFIALIITGLALALAASAMSSSTDGIKRVGTSVKFMANYYTSGGNRWVVTGSVSNGSLSPSGRRVYVFRDGTNYLGSTYTDSHGNWTVTKWGRVAPDMHGFEVTVQDRFLGGPTWVDELPAQVSHIGGPPLR